MCGSDTDTFWEIALGAITVSFAGASNTELSLPCAGLQIGRSRRNRAISPLLTGIKQVRTLLVGRHGSWQEQAPHQRGEERW